MINNNQILLILIACVILLLAYITYVKQSILDNINSQVNQYMNSNLQKIKDDFDAHANSTFADQQSKFEMFLSNIF